MANTSNPNAALGPFALILSVIVVALQKIF